MRSRLPFGEKLRAGLGVPGRARELASSPRSRVWRAELSGTPVVIKQLVEGPDADDRYAREVGALRLASRVDPPVVPVLLGTDPDDRVLVLEHLEERPPREDWVVEYAAALARLHAAADTDTASALPTWPGPDHDDIDSFLALARRLRVEVPRSVPAALDALVNRLSCTPHRSLLHGDPCPGNDLHTADGVRFIDFEQASLGNGLVELAYLRIGFPTCWCSTAPAPPLLAAAETAYRTAWREATGADTGADTECDLADACAGWVLRGDALVQRAQRGTTDHLAELSERDWHWGTATARQRLAHRLGVVGRLTAGGGELADLGRLATAMRTAMLAQWPTLHPLPSRRP
ncbi:phosphotransferase family protein [Streptomyces sp. NPDC058284]|uniref:phosphotransferase family protein n=1 Tax=unclassified Streptomyces TaxID=2593676 RepID=UPI0036640BCF